MSPHDTKQVAARFRGALPALLPEVDVVLGDGDFVAARSAAGT